MYVLYANAVLNKTYVLHKSGSIHPKWNWLEGYSSSKIDPKIVHFTRGGPWFKKLNFKIGKLGQKYFNEWEHFFKQLKKQESSFYKKR